MVAPGVERTNALKLEAEWGSASLFKPDSVNSSPSAAWINALAPSALLPLAGSRFERMVLKQFDEATLVGWPEQVKNPQLGGLRVANHSKRATTTAPAPRAPSRNAPVRPPAAPVR